MDWPAIETLDRTTLKELSSELSVLVSEFEIEAKLSLFLNMVSCLFNFRLTIIRCELNKVFKNESQL